MPDMLYIIDIVQSSFTRILDIIHYIDAVNNM